MNRITHYFKSLLLLELLAGLAPCVVGPGDLDATEGAGGQAAAVLPGEGGTDRRHVVDDPDRLLPEPEGVCLAAAEVTALDGVLDEPGDRVVVDRACPGAAAAPGAGRRDR